MSHGWTYHGHACCGLFDDRADPVARPLLVARCGGPAICSRCATSAAELHAAGQDGNGSRDKSSGDRL